MALITLNVKKRLEGNGSTGVTYSTATDEVVESTRIIYAAPSLCKTNYGIDTDVRSLVKVAGTSKDITSTVRFYCTQTVATIAGLT